MPTCLHRIGRILCRYRICVFAFETKALTFLRIPPKNSTYAMESKSSFLKLKETAKVICGCLLFNHKKSRNVFPNVELTAAMTSSVYIMYESIGSSAAGSLYG